MEVRYCAYQVRTTRMNTEELRGSFLVEDYFTPGKLQLLYSNVDRAIIGSAVPTSGPLKLEGGKELASDYFTERREVGVINVGGAGSVRVEGEDYPLENRDALYIGKSNREVVFSSGDAANPAAFYILSYPAHASHPTQVARQADAVAVHMGSDEEANKRTIYKYIHLNGIQSCQLIMGFTELAAGSVWNTMPAHTHERRSEVYLYFDVPDDAVVFHFMGTPQETRHLVVRKRQAIISPSWSLHAGSGTRNYCFIWGMGGENQDFTNMDGIGMDCIR
jgi:4-deoxy-L-threo-5-hexosulose-uronate ketol-isomerase